MHCNKKHLINVMYLVNNNTKNGKISKFGYSVSTFTRNLKKLS